MKPFQIFAAAILMMGMAACSNDENIPGNDPVAAQFMGNINEAKLLTRMADQNWAENDRIGITGKSGDTQYTNIPYRATQNGTDGKFVAVGQEIYFQNLDEVSFTAYYPYQEGEGTVITADTKKQSVQKDFDFLYGTGTGSKERPTVDLTFDHKMSKVILKVKGGDDVTFEDVKKAVLGLGNLVHEGTFDYADNVKVALSGTAVTDWTFYNNSTTAEQNTTTTTEDAASKTVTCTLILFPQEFKDDAMLTFKADIAQGGNTGTQQFSATIDLSKAESNDGNKLVGGTQYTIPVTINKTKMTVGTPTINPWNPTELPGIDAEM